MTDSDSPVSPDLQDSGDRSVHQEIRALRTMLHITLVVVVVVSGSLSVVLLRQVISMRRQVRDMSAVVMNYTKNEAPVLEEFRLKLDEFARRNPDFRPILSKYFQPSAASGQGQGTSHSVPPVQAPSGAK
jgi:hypothetical protein